MLTNESPRYLFGAPTSQNCRLTDHLSDLNLGTEQRARSDSSGSNMSNASTSSATARPPFNSSHSVSYNVPGFRGPITAFEQPSTAPVMPNDINQFMNSLPHNDPMQHASSGDIPHINCNNSVSQYERNYSGYRATNFTQHSGNSSVSSSPAMMRQIEVQHIQSQNENRGESPSVSQHQPSYTYRIQFHPSGAAGNQQGTPSRGWVFQQPNSSTQMPYQNVVYPNEHQDTVIRSSDARTLPITQSYSNHGTPTRSPFNSPGEELPGYPLYGAQGPAHYGSQHSSQATIFLSNPTATSHHYPTMPRTVQQSPIQGLYNPGSLNDVRQSPGVNMMRSNSSNSQPSPQGGQVGPVVVEITTPRQGGSGVQSQIQFFNSISGPAQQGQGSALQTPTSGYMGHVSPQGEAGMPMDPSATGGNSPFVRQYNPQDRSTVINFNKCTSREENSAGFLKFPPMPSDCRVPGHSHGLTKTCSVDSEPVFVSEMEYNRIMSPASSHSSLSSESSAVRERPQSSGSVEEPGYLHGKE